MEENMQHFWHIMLYHFKKGKNATEMQKRFVQSVEKVLWLTEHVKGVLWSFMLEMSCWTMLHVEVDSDQIKTLSEDNQRYTTWKVADMLRISKSIKLLVKVKRYIFYLQEKN